ncbi:MAG TPA: DUF58 domain-containing protein, partial [Bacteroidales bacterium]|nr:DUF58 domain-containing protein [Bacteroidales bacterium]
NAIKRRCTAFLLSDLIDVDKDLKPRYEEALKIAVNRHDISVVSVYDPRERELPDVGLVKVRDAERGKEEWVDTSSKSVRQYFAEWNEKVMEVTQQCLRKYKVDSVSIATNEDYVKGLISLFNRR